ncbi:MAG: DNA mismatch repair protein MutS [Bacteroidota bacterium]|nr:DNA mismatch repair protein MutS [Bacteroidota bacterium]
MHVDITTLQDLSIFHHEEEQSAFHHLDFTHTNGGRDYLHYILSNTLDSIAEIEDSQRLIKKMMMVSAQWPATITNGTIMVIERFYDTPVDAYPPHPSVFNSFIYKLMNAGDYSLTRYSVEHFISFVQGYKKIVDLLGEIECRQLQTWIERVKQLLGRPSVQQMLEWKKEEKLSPLKALTFGVFLRHHFKHEAFELIDIYSRLDAYLSLALAFQKYKLCFPSFVETNTPFIEAEQLYHLQLDVPVSYNVSLNQEKNFLFLTGANMAGKSTFIKAVGICVYLAHIGMGVPAASMQLCLFEGLLSNIHVVDNILKGESYFFNEVQRIKSTIEKINDGKKWLILIDELFKGTNVQDAMKCSTVVIEGLLKMRNALFILSTHLYEIGDDLKKYNNIQFRYFETTVSDEQLVFSYQLKEGISNDRLGYLILKREGVVGMLEKL